MDLKKGMESFIERYQKNAYAMMLQSKKEVAVTFRGTESEVGVIYSPDGIRIEEGIEPTLVITGTEEGLVQAMEGTVPLQKSIYLNQLQYKGNFRELLMIESILYLCKSKGF